MTTSVSNQAKELSVLASSPIWASDAIVPIPVVASRGTQFTLASEGGYESSTIQIETTKESAEEWYDRGLGMDIKIHGADGIKELWNGFVNTVTVTMGTLTASKGPLLGIANDANLVYSSVDTSTVPPVVGGRTFTGWNADDDSQEKYGTIQKVLSAGGIPVANADQVRDTFLAETKEPETDRQLNIGATANPKVTLGCLGYIYFMKVYVYNSTTTGTRTISDRIVDLLSADPSSRLSTDDEFIISNATTIARYTNDNKLAFDHLKNAVSQGDASFNRYIYGIYKGRKMHYEAAPTTIEYYHRIFDEKQRIESVGGVEVEPWHVQAGKWLMISDWLIGKTVPGADPQTDQRAMFLEKVIYTSPRTLSLIGSKVNTLPQLLGRLGLAGIGA